MAKVFITSTQLGIHQANTALNKAIKDAIYYVESAKGFHIHFAIDEDLDSIFIAENSGPAPEKGDILIFQYPTWTKFKAEEKILSYARSYGLRFICIVHDSMAIRMEQAPINNLEINFLNRCDVLVVAGEMKKRLEQYGVQVPIIERNILFGFRIEDKKFTLNEDFSYPTNFKSLIYTGNLAKSLWMLQYKQNTTIDMYGNWPENWNDGPEILPERLIYHGSVSAENLPLLNYPGFGLSWDGWTYPDMTGLGRYNMYNQAFKITQYFAYGLPVIVWSAAAQAKFITESKLGFAINNLTELDEKLAEITYSEYITFLNHTREISPMIRSGQIFLQALWEARNLVLSM
jgi:hypothetical protein